jgi:DnaJ-class molecular chaperone
MQGWLGGFLRAVSRRLPTGDLHVVIRLREHPVFQCEDNDLHSEDADQLRRGARRGDR